MFGVAGNEEIANFLLQNGAGFSSYILMDHPAFSKHLLRLKLQEAPSPEGEQVRARCEAASIINQGLYLALFLIHVKRVSQTLTSGYSAGSFFVFL